MVDNTDLQDLYRTLADVLDGYNKTHDTQVSSVDFDCTTPEACYNGSVVCREYEHNIIDYHYRDLVEQDFDWYSPVDWAHVQLDREAIAAKQRKEAQRAHREGRKVSNLWYIKHRNDQPICDVYNPVW